MAKITFLEKLSQRVQRVDKEELLHLLADLTREKGVLDAALQSLPDGLLILDLNARVLYANRSCLSLLGWESKGVLGAEISSLPSDHGLSFLAASKLHKGEAWHREVELFQPRKCMLAVDLLPLRSDRGEIFGSAVILKDITEKRRMEGRMAQSEKLGALSLLAAGLAHEIGNPLNSINIHLQLMDRELRGMKTAGKGPAKLKKLNATVQEEIKRLDGIVHRFLAAIRPLKPRMAPTDINALWREVLRLLKPELSSRKVRVKTSFAANVPQTLMDAAQIKQAFINLVKNAMQAMPRGGNLLLQTALADNSIRTVIEDSGTGIAPEHLGKIFDPYFTTREDGSGLGLMMTYRIVKEHGGDIEVKSVPGKGTAFAVLLPLRSLAPKMLTERGMS